MLQDKKDSIKYWHAICSAQHNTLSKCSLQNDPLSVSQKKKKKKDREE